MYILTLNGEPKQTTNSTDHVSAWKLRGKGYNYTEVPHFEESQLSIGKWLQGFGDEIEVYSDSETCVFTVQPELYYEYGELKLGQIIVVTDTGEKVLLNKCNFTQELVSEIESEIDRFIEANQSELVD